jgi:hypothetical protein
MIDGTTIGMVIPKQLSAAILRGPKVNVSWKSMVK